MKNCLIVINTHKKESHITGQLIANYLSKKGIKSSFFCFDGFSSETEKKTEDNSSTMCGFP